MFSKTDQTSAATVPAARISNTKSIFGSDLIITGEVTSLGDIEVHGQVDGTIAARTVTVGNGGKVSGSISAETLDVRGKLDGQIAAGNFTLRVDANVNADVTYRSVVIESGAQIEGRFALAKD